MHPLINIAVKAARRAGNLLIRQQERLEKVSVKQNARGGVTSDADTDAEQHIIDTIQKSYPRHKILSEESGEVAPLESAELTAGVDNDIANQNYEWIIDPLDGTSNYLHAHPHFCISIGIKLNQRLEHAVIFDPLRDELFTATRGGGARLNARRLRVSRCTELAQATLATTCRARESHRVRAANIHSSGSAALDLAYLAAGRFDGMWASGLQAWDVAAGALLVREAGGLVADFDGGEDFLQGGQIVAAGRGLLHELLAALRQCDKTDEQAPPHRAAALA